MTAVFNNEKTPSYKAEAYSLFADASYLKYTNGDSGLGAESPAAKIIYDLIRIDQLARLWLTRRHVLGACQQRFSY